MEAAYISRSSSLRRWLGMQSALVQERPEHSDRERMRGRPPRRKGSSRKRRWRGRPWAGPLLLPAGAMPHRAASLLLLPCGKPLPSTTSSTPGLPPPSRHHCATLSSPPLRHAAAMPCRTAVSPAGVLHAAIVGRKRRSSLRRHIASSPWPGEELQATARPATLHRRHHREESQAAAAALRLSLMLSGIHSVFHPPPPTSSPPGFFLFMAWSSPAPPSVLSLNDLGGEKVEVDRRWGGRWGFPHLHDVGDKNPQTLGTLVPGFFMLDQLRTETYF